jgi:hypothetical protein
LNRFENGLGVGMAGKDRSHLISDIFGIWEVRVGSVDIDENLAIFDLDRKTSEAGRHGIDPGAAADVILPVMGSAGK